MSRVRLVVDKQVKNNISWPDVVFLAEAEHEPFATVQIITLYAHCLNLAEEMNLTLPCVEQAEQVQVFEDRVLIVVDTETVDDDAVTRGLDFLTQMDNFEVGNKKEMGPRKWFKLKKLH